MTEYVHIRNVPEVMASMRAIGEEVGRKVLRRVALAGARIVRQAVRADAPIGDRARVRGRYRVQPGTLRRAVLAKYARELSGPSQQGYVVTLRRGKREQARGRDAYYWPWVERGHKIVPRRGKNSAMGIRTRRRMASGRVPPHPFFAPAYDASAAQALATMAATMQIELIKVLP